MNENWINDLGFCHPYLSGRGFAEQTMRCFGVGWCGSGMFDGRIAIPLHTDRNKLIGYTGRLATASTISDENPKYYKAIQVSRHTETFFVSRGQSLAPWDLAIVAIPGQASSFQFSFRPSSTFLEPPRGSLVGGT